MSAGAVILSCVGALVVTFNKPVGEYFHRANVALGVKGYDPWAYRWPFIFFGALLLLWSLFPDLYP